MSQPLKCCIILMPVDDFTVFRCCMPYLPITMSFLMDFTVGLVISVKAAIRTVDAFEILLFKFHPWPCVHAKQETLSAGTI